MKVLFINYVYKKLVYLYVAKLLNEVIYEQSLLAAIIG